MAGSGQAMRISPASSVFGLGVGLELFIGTDARAAAVVVDLLGRDILGARLEFRD